MKFLTPTLGLLAVSIVVWTTPLSAAAAVDAPVQATRSQSSPLSMNGAVTIDRTWGEVSIEGWDQPSVEVTVTARSKKAYPAAEAEGMRARLAAFGFETKAASPGQLAITGLSPNATLLKPFGGKSGVSVAYSIRMPRAARLTLRHDVGEVAVKGLESDLDVASRIGDVRLTVPLDASVAVEGSARIGEVSVNPALGARGSAKRHALVGHSFSYAPSNAHRHIIAHVGIGSVAID